MKREHSLNHDRLSACAFRASGLRRTFQSGGTRDQLIPDLVEIVGEHPKADIARKAMPPFVGTAIHPMLFQAMNVRFNGTVLPP